MNCGVVCQNETVSLQEKGVHPETSQDKPLQVDSSSPHHQSGSPRI